MQEHPSTHSFPVFRALGERPKSPVERLLSIFADVRAGEGGTVLLLFTNGFLLMSAYYVLKTIREALILWGRGAEAKSYSAAAQAAVLLLLIPLYGKFASRVSRVQLLTCVNLFFASHLGLFYLAAQQKWDLGISYYVWLGILNMLLVAQFWGFANDLHTEAQGKRLFAIVGAGVAIGGVAGAYAASRLFRGRILDAYEMMLLGGLLLAGTVPFTRAAHNRELRQAQSAKAEAAQKPLGKEGGFELLLQDRYLFLIAVLVLLLNFVNSTGEYVLGKFLETEAVRAFGAGESAKAARQAFTGELSGAILFWQNIVVMVIQAFFVSRILLRIGVRGALFVLPVLAFGAYLLIAFVPVLSLVRLAKIAENGTDYSLSNTVRGALFLPTSRVAKYKAKAAIDTFFARFGDMLQAGVVFLGVRLAFTPSGFAMVNLAAVCLWLWVAVLIAREHKRRSGLSAAAAAA